MQPTLIIPVASTRPSLPLVVCIGGLTGMISVGCIDCDKKVPVNGIFQDIEDRYRNVKGSAMHTVILGLQFLANRVTYAMNKNKEQMVNKRDECAANVTGMDETKNRKAKEMLRNIDEIKSIRENIKYEVEQYNNKVPLANELVKAEANIRSAHTIQVKHLKEQISHMSSALQRVRTLKKLTTKGAISAVTVENKNDNVEDIGNLATGMTGAESFLQIDDDGNEDTQLFDNAADGKAIPSQSADDAQDRNQDFEEQEKKAAVSVKSDDDSKTGAETGAADDSKTGATGGEDDDSKTGAETGAGDDSETGATGGEDKDEPLTTKVARAVRNDPVSEPAHELKSMRVLMNADSKIPQVPGDNIAAGSRSEREKQLVQKIHSLKFIISHLSKVHKQLVSASNQVQSTMANLPSGEKAEEMEGAKGLQETNKKIESVKSRTKHAKEVLLDSISALRLVRAKHEENIKVDAADRKAMQVASPILLSMEKKIVAHISLLKEHLRAENDQFEK